MDYVRELPALVGHRPLIVAAPAVLVLDGGGRVLLQHRRDGRWGLLGGALEPGETLEDAARRETREETTLELGALTLVDLCSGPDFFHRYPNGDEVHLVMAVYESRQPEGEAVPDGREGVALAYFDLDDLPPDLLPVAARALDRYRDARASGSEPSVSAS